MDNPFAKFFGENKTQESVKPPEVPITVGGKPLEEYNDDDLPPGAEYADEDCEGCESEYDDCGVIEKSVGSKHPGGTLADNAKLGELNKGYAKASKGVQERRAGKITFKK